MSIDTENSKQIRPSMEVYAGLDARQNVALSYSITGEVKSTDSNYAESLITPTWNMRTLADFQGEGFILDGSAELYDDTVASEEDGKQGIRGDIGGEYEVEVTAQSSITAVTIAVTSGTGTITANGVTYEARRIVVVPVNATSITLTVASDDAESRVEIASITAGISIDFTRENLVSVSLDLRADLSIINPSWAISSIEIQAYWDDDISEAVSNIGDDVPIWYYSGYDSDMAPVRHFYLSEAVTSKDNLLTIRGEDMSHKLEDARSLTIRRIDSVAKSGKATLYNYFTSVIKGAGIKPVSIESAPASSGSSTTGYSLVMQENSPRDIIADIMNTCRSGTFYPAYVDAGIPTVRWTRPSSKWTISEEDCGDVSVAIDRNIAKIQTPPDSQYGITNTCTRASKYSVIQANMSITSGKPIVKNFNDSWYWTYKVAYAKNNKFDFTTLNSVKWTPNKTTKKKKSKKNGKTVTTWLYRPTLYGKRLTTTVNARSITEANKRAGYTAELTPLAIGKMYQGTTMIYPDYQHLFNRSNKTYTFTWKGHPKMQPRDVMTFNRVDGTSVTGTIENIQLKHEGGGTIATIVMREGII